MDIELEIHTLYKEKKWRIEHKGKTKPPNFNTTIG